VIRHLGEVAGFSIDVRRRDCTNRDADRKRELARDFLEALPHVCVGCVGAECDVRESDAIGESRRGGVSDLVEADALQVNVHAVSR
jgi:hypothetical protein